ncbi:MAG: hypothetical protein HFI09_01955 [Bacilli bacterium]|nr:hypothetical protein [Bacilli bacterium]
MKKKKKIVNRRNGDVIFPKRMSAIKRYVALYLERKKQKPFDESLELQKAYLIQILKVNHIYHSTYDDDFLQNLILKSSDNVRASVDVSKKKKKNVLSNTSLSEYSKKREVQYQMLILKYYAYLKRVGDYSDFLDIFQNYFYPIIDVYNIDEDMALKLTKGLIQVKEKKR